MSDRVNLVDAYDNRSVIAKLVNMKEEVEGAKIASVTSSESGNTVTVTLTLGDGTQQSFTFQSSTGAALNKEQTFTEKQTFAKDVVVQSDLSVTDELKAGSAEIAGMAIEESSGATVLSNEDGVKVNGHDLNKADILDEEQTITAKKTHDNVFTIMKGQNGHIDRYAPFGLDDTFTSTGYDNIIRIFDNDAKLHAWLEEQITTDKVDSLMLTLRGYDTDGNLVGLYGNIGIIYDPSTQHFYARCPTPTASDPSSSIVNKAFVQDTNGISNIAHLNAVETFTQSKYLGKDEAYVSGSFQYTSTLLYALATTFLGGMNVVHDANDSMSMVFEIHNPDYNNTSNYVRFSYGNDGTFAIYHIDSTNTYWTKIYARDINGNYSSDVFKLKTE